MAQLVKILPAMQETHSQSLGPMIPWRWKCQPTLVFLPGEFYGERSLAGYSPQGHKESDMTEQLTLHVYGIHTHTHTHTHIYTYHIFIFLSIDEHLIE